jgi:hypothetical protein
MAADPTEEAAVILSVLPNSPVELRLGELGILGEPSRGNIEIPQVSKAVVGSSGAAVEDDLAHR